MALDRRLASELFDAAVCMRVVATVLQFGTFGLLAGIIYFGWSSALVAIGTMVTMILLAVVSYFGKEWQRFGNETADLLDIADAFGGPLPVEPVRALKARIPAFLEGRALRRTPVNAYFNTRSPHGARRALEMYSESSWWSSELSRRHEQLYGLITAVTIVVFVLLSITALIVVDDKTARTQLAESVASFAVLLISLGLGQQVLSYRSFSRAAESIHKAAARLSDRHSLHDLDALSIMHQYQTARAAAPPLHRWIWRANRSRLNRLWEEADVSGDSTQLPQDVAN